MSLFGNYNTPGQGVPKAPMEKKGFFKFMEIYGRRFWKLTQLNLIFIIACLPIVTIGPAIAGMTKVARNYSQERNAFIWSDFWAAFKKCFKQSFIMGILDLFFGFAFIVGLPVYYSMAEQNSMMYIPLVICISCMLVFIMMNFYIYLMIVSTNLKFIQILKNSLFLVALGLKNTVFTLLTWIMVIVLLVLLGYFAPILMLIWPFAFMCFVTSFNCYPVIRKYVIQPYYDEKGEDNPEFDYLKLKDGEEAIFEDNLQLEKESQNNEKPQVKKGKTIS